MELTIEKIQVFAPPKIIKSEVVYEVVYENSINSLSPIGLIFSIRRKNRFKPRNRGLYRFEVRKSKLYRVDAKTQFTHFMGEGVVEEINRLCIEAINKTRND